MDMGTGVAIAGSVMGTAIAVVKLMPNGKYVKKEVFEEYKSSIDRQLNQIMHILERIEGKIDKHRD